MLARWPCITTFSILIACGGQSTTDGTAKGAGGSSAQGGSGGSATGGFSGNGGSLAGASGGGGSPCRAIMDSWVETMRSVKVCNPFIDLNECTATLPSAIICSCAPTYMNPANTEALEKLEQIEDEAFAGKCLPLSCPAIACEQPVIGTCEPDPSGNSGTCRDLYANDDPGGP